MGTGGLSFLCYKLQLTEESKSIGYDAEWQRCVHYLSYKSYDTTIVTEKQILPQKDNSIVLHIRISTGATR